jgi:hypothetical protein
MTHKRTRSRGLTMVEVLLLIGIFACVLVMLFPAIQAARETSRRETCFNNMKRLGLAYHEYVTANHHMCPPSSGVTRDENGKIIAVDGWSWQVLLMPYMSHDVQQDATASKSLYDSVDIVHGKPLTEPEREVRVTHADLLARQLPGLLCPSSGCSPYTDFCSKKAAITNYKCLGASHIESLSAASPNPLTPKCGSTPLNRGGSDEDKGALIPHPDGNCFPGTSLNIWAMAKNGTSNSLLLVESQEQRYARWTVGAEATVVGFPRNVDFEESEKGIFMPKGYGKALKKEADSTYWDNHTYLDWNYEQTPYDAADGDLSDRYGPSSGHTDSVNHLLFDGSCRGIYRTVDPAIYMWLIRGRMKSW